MTISKNMTNFGPDTALSTAVVDAAGDLTNHYRHNLNQIFRALHLPSHLVRPDRCDRHHNSDRGPPRAVGKPVQ